MKYTINNKPITLEEAKAAIQSGGDVEIKAFEDLSIVTDAELTGILILVGFCFLITIWAFFA